MSAFVFQSPIYLSLLALAFPLAWLLARARHQRLRVIAAMGGGLPTHRRLRDNLRLTAFCLMVLALARPGYSPYHDSSTRSGRDVVFALDVSRSMLAQDLAPSRLEVAKQGIRDALDSFTNERVGLILYAGSASILSPLTYDYGFTRYMLEQAQPRSVDFGGTTLQAAVEKAVDQVFMEGRGNLQDLIVLTDGGDHGSQIPRVLELLNQHAVDTLLIGLGDPDHASPIPVKDSEGTLTQLEANGSVVYTRLDDSSLRALASQSPRINYVSAGTHAFHLGQVYTEYAADKSVESVEESSSQWVYREAAIYFLLPAVLLLFLAERWGARGLQFGLLFGCACFMSGITELRAADPAFQERYQSAGKQMESGQYAEAEAALSELYRESVDAASPRSIAALQFNRGICLLKLSEAQADAAPAAAQNDALSARAAFLSAKRFDPTLHRAGIRLDRTAVWLAELEQRIEQEQQAEQEKNEALQALVDQLKALLEAQTALRNASMEAIAPEDRSEMANTLSSKQEALLKQTQGIQVQMQALDRQLSGPLHEAMPVDSILSEPLKRMPEVASAQERTKALLADFSSWRAARANGRTAENKIQEILDLLVGQSESSDEGEEDWEEYEDDYYDDVDNDQESMNASEAMQGDFAAGSTMQALPVPNYSTEDILLEEQSNLQFRQQQRASVNASKVEKDY